MAQTDLELGLIDEPIGSVEARLVEKGFRYVVGLDEVGRGPLAGPVTVAAVVLDLQQLDWCVGLNDSKKLTADDRESWSCAVRSSAVASALVHVPVEDIDRLNILWASLHGMNEATRELHVAGTPMELALVDGNRAVPDLQVEQRTLVKGDARSFAIAAASVLAKVSRDRLMKEAEQLHPGYGFARHKGYPTKQHLEALRRLGPTPIHRRSFRPVRDACEEHGVS